MKEEARAGKRKKIRSTAMAFLVFISETSGIRSVLQKREAHTKCDSKGLGIPNMQAHRKTLWMEMHCLPGSEINKKIHLDV